VNLQARDDHPEPAVAPRPFEAAALALSSAFALRNEPDGFRPYRAIHLDRERPDRRDEICKVVAVGHGEVRPVLSLERLSFLQPTRRDSHSTMPGDGESVVLCEIADKRGYQVAVIVEYLDVSGFVPGDDDLAAPVFVDIADAEFVISRKV